MRPVCGPPARSEQITTLKYNRSSLLLTTNILKENYVGKIISQKNSPQGEGYRFLLLFFFSFCFFAVFLHQDENKLIYWSFSALKCTTMPVNCGGAEISVLQICRHVSSSLRTQCVCYITPLVWLISNFNYFWSQHFHFRDQLKNTKLISYH